MFEGSDIVKLAETRVGQKYVLGARVNLANPNWRGPWDCAEFVSWAAYHAYKMVIAVKPPNIQVGESFSGWWHEAALELDGVVSVKKAIGTAGAILIRKPGFSGMRIGHVAISRGDGTTVEAHSARVGVAIMEDAGSRSWSSGFLIPGVKYLGASSAIDYTEPQDLLQLASPFMRGPKVVALQNALVQQGVDPGPIDGIYGPATATAVAAFQAQAGLVVDGVVGPQTKQALGL